MQKDMTKDECELDCLLFSLQQRKVCRGTAIGILLKQKRDMFLTGMSVGFLSGAIISAIMFAISH